ncbi:beta-galactosidase 15-like isoform X2 [Silene latifolia]|uniref:beta-galactosidase 15-like isoform X2 n=1 Tax=Silene latifolia TaxID=37657 RepID=UPI003D775F9E
MAATLSHKTCTLTILLAFFVYIALATQVTHDGRSILINGERKIILSGSIHYPRSTPEMWPDLIRKAKEGGLDAIETYVFWNAHEPKRRQYDFNGNNDLIRFIKTVQDAGLYAILRIGPYTCAEWNYGGFPVWLHNLPGIELRTDNKVFKDEMQNFTTLIVDMIKEENLFASQGGPIILAQIENEYGNVMSPYGDAGKAYINWCAKMAVAQNIGVPWIMCQQSDAPQPMINTCNGWYCHDFTPNNPNSPKMWTENWTGWFTNWGGKLPHRTAEDVAYAVARFFQTGGTLQNYYMYHGGTNFGRTSGGPYIATSYDYDAPLDEYGNLNQPKWGHLEQLHSVLHSMEKVLTYGDIVTIAMNNLVNVTKYSYNNSSSCFISNDNTTNDATILLGGQKYTIPAWSVSILQDCQKEVYNTAKVNTQTSMMVTKPNEAEEEPRSLAWSWRREQISKNVVQGRGSFAAHGLIEQKAATNDTSDYLWYMTRVNLDKNDIIWSDDMRIRVNSSGHVLHIYVNGQDLGYDYGKDDSYGINSFEKKIKLKAGKNVIALLSATVGLKNYGAYFDMVPTGITGPVELLGVRGDETVIKNLTLHTWSYLTGLQGLDRDMLFSERSVHATRWRSSGDFRINTTLTWYKTTFKAPIGTDPVVVDLTGMGKGAAWVNGQSIGRYWPAFVAGEDGCSLDACDYRGQYDNNKCVTNCGKPTQTLYHVPRSFLKDDVNTLVLFEEFGGNPSQVNFRTVTIGGACAKVYEGNSLNLSCNGKPISEVKFASYGDPQGVCDSFGKGSCEGTNDAHAILTKACVGKETCSVDVTEAVFGDASNCSDKAKRLAVEIVC